MKKRKYYYKKDMGNEKETAEDVESKDTKKIKKPLAYHIGNVLIILSVLLLAFIYFPLLSIYFPKNISIQEVHATVSQPGFYVYIPKINAYSKIIEQVDPWNKNEYLSALKKGVAQAKDSGYPGDTKTIFLFAHSSGPPWEITRTNTLFLRLGELNNGDQISLYKDGKEYKYTVVDKKEIWPQDTRYLKDLSKDQLILQTCTPIGTDLKRLLVFAKPQ